MLTYSDKSVYTHYPFGLHDRTLLPDGQKPLPWTFGRVTNSTINLISNKCEGNAPRIQLHDSSTAPPCCQECEDIQSHRHFHHILRCADNMQSYNAHLRYFGIAELVEKDRLKQAQIKQYEIEKVLEGRNTLSERQGVLQAILSNLKGVFQ